ncbi:hypothetical protein TrVFT333_005455 [Trichoderma virens FT-333]|nr:hypothetical protein TrVFT333_005455 [Trichoderma virens FT-333]
MKLIIVGSSGFVGKELVRQAITSPAVTSVVAIARRETPVPESLKDSSDVAKLTSVVCDDFLNYSDNVKHQISNADACIWLMAVTPSNSGKMPWDEVRKICLDYTIAGLEDGANAERDQSKKPWILGDYCLMRGEVETRVLDFAKNSNNAIEACIVKPGLIRDPQQGNMLINTFQNVATSIINLPVVYLHDVAATLLNQATEGFEKETLDCDDIVRIGKKT